MAKNAKNKNVYQITISGRTTNGFTAKVLDNIVKVIAATLVANLAQSKLKLEVIQTIGDYDAINGKYREGVE